MILNIKHSIATFMFMSSKFEDFLKKKRLKDSRLAQVCNMPESTWLLKKRNPHEITAKDILKLSSFLRVKPEEIFYLLLDGFIESESSLESLTAKDIFKISTELEYQPEKLLKRILDKIKDVNMDDYEKVQELVKLLVETKWVTKNDIASLEKHYGLEKIHEAIEMERTTYNRRKNNPGELRAAEIIKLASVFGIAPIALFAIVEKQIAEE